MIWDQFDLFYNLRVFREIMRMSFEKIALKGALQKVLYIIMNHYCESYSHQLEEDISRRNTQGSW